MKNIFAVAVIACATTFVACTPSAKEKSEIKTKILDSIKKSDLQKNAIKLDSIKKLDSMKKIQNIKNEQSKKISTDDWIGDYKNGWGEAMIKIKKNGSKYSIIYSWAGSEDDGPYIATVEGLKLKYSSRGKLVYISHSKNSHGITSSSDPNKYSYYKAPYWHYMIGINK